MTGDDDPHNGFDLRGMGSYGYKAPEQKYCSEELDAMSLSTQQRADLEEDYMPNGVKKGWPLLGTHTNVWQVGACMYELIVLTGVTYDLVKAKNEGRVLGKVQTHRTPEYSKALTDLVHRCLKIAPGKRPTLKTLGEIIESRRSAFKDQWARGETVPEEAAVFLDPDQIDGMDVGPFVKGSHIIYDLDADSVYE
ncbi:MAG: hypothetical protein Q9169_001079 [Polycauliona sp. 2 TL-2023]